MLHLFVLLQFTVDVTFPHIHNVVTFAFQVLDLCHGAVVNFLHGFAIDGIAGVTSRTFVPETAVDLERGMCFFVVAVEQIVTFAFLAARVVIKFGFATARALAMHKSSSFRILTMDLLFSKCFSKFTLSVYYPYRPLACSGESRLFPRYHSHTGILGWIE